ncbi:MAG: hypothetical protein GOMPHAMPRED_002065 [Gomphillus americanus]|uniref:Enoyl-CoA hydratase n=1 Tax=Gomphillus americanus TaxID=1940652 RepID=A0A8H3FGA1_9LECA|nr:MAG: hypothetical protein GOMPHAMPRED_002065 [Gomphillus americanus]
MIVRLQQFKPLASRCISIRHSSTSTSLINIRSIPAPHSGSIRVLSLNNPQTRNAISRALLTELASHINEIYTEGPQGSTRAVILASDIDTSFCAGADLKERRGFTLEETKNFLTTLRGTFKAISQMPIPTITALSSVALGGGLELALTTHLRVFASTSIVGLPETRLAIIPGAGGTYRLPAVIGQTRAMDLMLTGRRVQGPEAYFLGICDRLVEVTPEETKIVGAVRTKVLDAAIQLARDICEGGPGALRAVISAAGQGEDAENQAYETVIGMKDRDEALVAFQEKRKPVFKGV